MKPAFILQIPNELQAKLGDTPLDATMLQQMEDALHILSGQFAQWLCEDVNRLQKAIRGARQTPDENSRWTLLKCCGDLKGMGTTYGYPLISRIAASACTLLTEAQDFTQALPLLEGHVAAITVLVDCEIRSEDHAEGQRLAHELEAQVRQFRGRILIV